MRRVYFSLSLGFVIISLIICFENIMYSVPLMIGFTMMGQNGIFWPLMLITSIGFLGGLFAGLGIMSGGHKKEDIDDDTLDL